MFSRAKDFIEMTSTYRFDTNWKIVLLVLLTLPLLLRLGFWQLERAAEKQQLQQTFQQRQEEAPRLVDDVIGMTGQELAYRRLVLEGTLDQQRTVLLDNRIRDGVVGYEVLQVLTTANGHHILVNRGWIAGFADRNRLPSLPVVQGVDSQGTTRTTGTLYVPVGKPFLLAEQQLAAKWPLVVQWLDIERIGTLLGQPLFPYSVRLESGQPGALRADWAAINTQPEKHRGYALQWFLMSAALLLFWLYLSVHRRQPTAGE